MSLNIVDNNVIAYEVFQSYRERKKLKRGNSSPQEQFQTLTEVPKFSVKNEEQASKEDVEISSYNVPLELVDEDLSLFNRQNNSSAFKEAQLEELFKLAQRRCQIARINSINLLQTFYKFMPLEAAVSFRNEAEASFQAHLEERLERSIMKYKRMQAEYLELLQRLNKTGVSNTQSYAESERKELASVSYKI